MKHLRQFLLTGLTLCSLLLAPVAFGASAAALAPTPLVASSVSDACAGIGMAGSGCKDSSGLSSVIKAIVNILTAIVGVVAVIMIIISGMKYITSGGDSNKVASAKGTLIYAIVGLVIVALAQIIVHFVITKVK